ncbi:MAG: type II toxin-antitoxin system RelE/ParE family toxin [Paramuribaculum sp.]|nr:type II toxin-antitoxin system RelE/ParE family toxin [Paramuribaculum sp.]
MIVEFDKTYLRDLYTLGHCNDKKHRLRPDVISRYKRCIDYLKWATRKEDLFRLNSLRFEALTGDKAGTFSISVNMKYRIEFTIRENDEEPILYICNILELSNHYD